MGILTIISALLGGIVGFAAAGLGASAVLESVFGGKDGGPAMSGFFGFGPIGGIAGVLLGAGLALRFGKRSLKWGHRLMISGGIVAASGGLLLVVASSRDQGASYSKIIEFEIEYPSATLAGIEIPSVNAMWGAAGADSDDHPISQFFDRKCVGNVCTVDGSIAALGPTTNFRIAASIGTKKYRYPIDLPATITGPVDWSAWRPGDGARIRWRIVNR